MDHRYSRKRLIDGAVEKGFVGTLRGDFHKRAKERTRAPDFT